MLTSSISDSVSQSNPIDIFPWDDNFNTGLAKVDEQHRRLVQLLNAIASHIAFRSDIPQLNEIFDELSDYAIYHFQTEEAIWHEFFDDDISKVEHRNAHASFVEQVARLKDCQVSKSKSQIVEGALDFLVRWLASHILESDRYMAYTVLAMKDGLTLNEAKLRAKEQMGGTTRTLIDVILTIYSTLSVNTLRLMRELAEHQQAKIALMRESERNRALLRLASDGIHILDQNGNIVEASDSFCAMLGYPRDDIIGMNVADWDAGFSKAELSQFFKKICASPDRFEFETRHRCKDGNLIEVEVSAIIVQVDKTPLVYASSRDITKRKQTELALHESQKRFYDIALASADWIWEVDAQSRYTYASDSVFSLLGYHPEELHDKTPFDFMPPDEANRVGETLGKIVATKSSFQNLENIVLGKNGSEHVILTNGTPILDTEGNLLGYRGVDRDITELKKTEVELNLTAQRLNEAQRMARIGNWELDLVANRLTWSDQVYSIFEIDKELFGPSYEAFLNVIHPGDREAVNSAYMQSLETRQAYTITHRLLFADGRIKYVHEQCETKFSETGNPLRSIGTVQDITERKRAEDALRESELHFRTLANGVNALIWTAGTNKLCDYFNDRWLDFRGRTLSEELGDGWNEGVHPEDLQRVLDIYFSSFGQRHTFNLEYRLRRADGEYRWIHDNGTPRFDNQGNFIGYIGFCYDMTEKRAHQEQLEYIAHYDSLTGMPNRKLMADRLRQAMVRTKRHNQRLAVVYIDLDGFKAINDNYGHAAGDQLLIVLANRMKQCFRDSDTFARLGGDEFVAVLVDLPDIQTSVPLILRVLAAAAKPVDFNDHTFRVSCSIGVAYYAPTDDTDADQLLRQADQAMYQAKLTGKNRYHVFDAVQDRTVRDRHANIERIQQALANNEFILYYQPKINLRSGEVLGAEALIRWQHPERGLLLPSLFLPEIEDHPLGVKLGEWVINTALIQLDTWQSLGLELSISVNIAANHLLQQDFVERLYMLLAANPSVPSNRLELEILETSALEDINHVSAVIAGCNQLGVQFSLDDFGAGYSSLTYLKRLPVRTLKIDQSFVHDMLSNTDDLAIIKGVLGLAASFNREVIAEGVETQAHGEALLQLGCELAQGYGIARPMPASDFYVWFETSNRKI